MKTKYSVFLLTILISSYCINNLLGNERRSSYVVGPARLSFDGISHHLDVAAIVVDTGSTYTVFAPPIYRFIEHVVRSNYIKPNFPSLKMIN